jgi:hypothetical protein
MTAVSDDTTTALESVRECWLTITARRGGMARRTIVTFRIGTAATRQPTIRRAR